MMLLSMLGFAGFLLIIVWLPGNRTRWSCRGTASTRCRGLSGPSWTWCWRRDRCQRWSTTKLSGRFKGSSIYIFSILWNCEWLFSLIFSHQNVVTLSKYIETQRPFNLNNFRFMVSYRDNKMKDANGAIFLPTCYSHQSIQTRSIIFFITYLKYFYLFQIFSLLLYTTIVIFKRSLCQIFITVVSQTAYRSLEYLVFKTNCHLQEPVLKLKEQRLHKCLLEALTLLPNAIPPQQGT